MRPEMAARAREAQRLVCHCPGDGPQGPPPPRGPKSQTSWRPTPWILSPPELEARLKMRPTNLWIEGGAFGFQHPVRLYLPLSKRQEYLSREKVLASLPAQATIHLYSDGSDSDEEQEEETQPSDLQCQEAEDSLGGKGRDRLTNPGRQPGGRGGLGGKGLLPNPESPEDAGCPSSQ
uniref:Protein ripply3 n=1 Tax=Balaenoptera musculus TaxID=9771 RepID=A0A8C0DRG6_BALMU